LYVLLIPIALSPLKYGDFDSYILFSSYYIKFVSSRAVSILPDLFYWLLKVKDYELEFLNNLGNQKDN